MVDKISVVIPARNEEENIKATIKIAKNSKFVEEVIVVNNNSTDNTYNIANQSGAKVINCEEIGKGNAMAKGVSIAQNDIIVFLDADILNYPENIIDMLTLPIINNEADFVKASFERTTGGMVTKIAVKPLLEILYPDLYKFQEPLSGMVAVKKDIIQNIKFDHDYGIDIGIVLDLYKMKVKMKEVNIGKIINMSHNNKDIEKMQKMSYEVINAIIKRQTF